MPPRRGQGLAGTGFRTGTAAGTEAVVNADPPGLIGFPPAPRLLIPNRPGGTKPGTAAAPGTFCPVPEDLYGAALGFGVGTPPAAQGASLKKHHRPNPRPVVDTKLLDVKNNSPDSVLLIVEPVPKLIDCALNAHGFGTTSVF
jgi:hypothetical protein